MNSRHTVVLCDDIEQTREGWKTSLESLQGFSEVFDVALVDQNLFRSSIRELADRRNQLRMGNSSGQSDTIFDDAAVLVVDYDLFNYDTDYLFSGDSVAYLARSFSRCGYIVGVNQDRSSNPFDATLTSHILVHTDVSVGSEQVADPGLWCRDISRWKNFRPWVWPLLPERAGRLPALAEELVDELSRPVQSVLGLERDLIATMPRSVVTPVDAPEFGNLNHLSLRDWVHASQMALRPGDRLHDDSQVARVAAARLSKWFERVVLPGQDVLVDAPHLVERRPGLLIDSGEADSWKGLARIDATPSELGLKDERVSKHRFGERWLSRPAWFWPSIGSDPELDNAAQAERPQPPLVFAEDGSRFVSRDDAIRVRTDLDSPFKSRWLARPDASVTYLPAARLTAA